MVVYYIILEENTKKIKLKNLHVELLNFRKHPDIPPTEENIIEYFPNDDESLIMKVIDKVIEGLSMTDEQRQNNMAAVKSNPMLGEMMSPWKDYALEFLNLLKKY